MSRDALGGPHVRPHGSSHVAVEEVSNDMLTRESAEAEVFKLAASVVEEPRQGGVARLLEKVAMQEQQAPLSAVLVEPFSPLAGFEATVLEIITEILEESEEGVGGPHLWGSQTGNRRDAFAHTPNLFPEIP